jgi:hypothetical protein
MTFDRAAHTRRRANAETPTQRELIEAGKRRRGLLRELGARSYRAWLLARSGSGAVERRVPRREGCE